MRVWHGPSRRQRSLATTLQDCAHPCATRGQWPAPPVPGSAPAPANASKQGGRRQVCWQVCWQVFSAGSCRRSQCMLGRCGCACTACGIHVQLADISAGVGGHSSSNVPIMQPKFEKGELRGHTIKKTWLAAVRLMPTAPERMLSRKTAGRAAGAHSAGSCPCCRETALVGATAAGVQASCRSQLPGKGAGWARSCRGPRRAGCLSQLAGEGAG